MCEAGIHLANGFGEMFLQGFTDSSVSSVSGVSGVSHILMANSKSGTCTTTPGYFPPVVRNIDHLLCFYKIEESNLLAVTRVTRVTRVSGVSSVTFV